MKFMLNFRKAKLCSEVVSFRWSEIRVWRLSAKVVNYLSFGFYCCYATEKQRYKLSRLPGIAYPFVRERGCVRTYAYENVGLPCGFVERIYA